MVEIELWTAYDGGPFPLNLQSLLSVMEEIKLSPSFDSFQWLRIRDRGKKWMKKGSFVNADVVEQYEASKLLIKEEESSNWDWIVVEPL